MLDAGDSAMYWRHAVPAFLELGDHRGDRFYGTRHRCIWLLLSVWVVWEADANTGRCERDLLKVMPVQGKGRGRHGEQGTPWTMMQVGRLGKGGGRLHREPQSLPLQCDLI